MDNLTNEFKTKTAIVTGGSRGIGKEICLQFAKQGSNIIFNYARHHKQAKETQDEILKLGVCLLYTSPSPRDATLSRMPSSA